MAGARSGSSFDVDQLLHTRANRSLRRLPALLLGALRLVWRAGRRELTLTIGLQILGSVALAAQLLLARDLLARLIDGTTTHDYTSATPLVAGLVLVLGVNALLGVLRTELQRLLAELVAWYSMRRVISAANAASLADFENPAFHDRLQRSIVNAAIRPIQMTTGLITVGTSLSSSVAIAATLVAIEPLFLPLGLLAVVPVTLVSLRVGRALFEFAVSQTPTDRERQYIQSLLVEKDPAKEIRAYDLGGYLAARYDRLYGGRILGLRRLVRTRMVQGLAGSALTAAVSGGTLTLLIVLVANGRVSLAGAGAAAAALLLLGTQLQGLAAGIGQLYESALFIADFTDFVDAADPAPPTTGLHAPGVAAGGGATTGAGRGGPVDIVLDHVSFTYPSRSEPSLTGIDLTVSAGEVVALVGENGSGKTTLAKLIAGLYPVEDGSIRWGGVDATQLPPGTRRRQTALLFQDFVRYFLTASDNIGLGDWPRSGDRAAVLGAAAEAGASDILESLPRGVDTFLGPQFFGGSDLSGGQWQRIALARAFFRDASLIILDEPTAALDPRAEASLFDSVRRLFAGRSVILISHRFASVRMADHIYVLDAGRITEHGHHAELMGRGGLYAELFTLQAAAFGVDR